MKEFYISIFWKFFIAIILTVSSFAFLNISFVWNNVFQIIDNEISKRIIYIGNNLANQSINYILYNDLSALQAITNNTKKIDSLILYCFIVDHNNQVLAHTFDSGFPKNILHVHQIKAKDSISIVYIKAIHFKSQNIKDIMIPILDGKIGYVRIGINEKISKQEVNNALIIFIIIFILFTLLGFLGAYIFSYIISNPIKNIKTAAELIDINGLNNKSYLINYKQKKYPKKIINIKDEIDDLSEKFEQMLNRLDSIYQNLILTQNSLNQSDKLASIGTFVAGIVHEINNPLSGLQSCLRRLTEQPNNYEQNKNYLIIMSEAVNKMQIIVKGLLDFTRKSGGIKTQNSFSKIIGNSLKLLYYYDNKLQVSIQGNYQDEKFILYCDRIELEQVFFNLLKNSFDALSAKLKINPNHQCIIKINLKQNDSKLIVELFDNGIGIEEKEIKKVLDPFYTTKDIGKGTGLGCSISYNIVKENNGTMEIKSKYLEWTIIKLTFELKNYTKG